MRVNEIAGIDKKRYKDYRLTKGVSGKGGEVGDIADMAKRHYDAWKRVVAKNKQIAQSNPEGLLRAWIEITIQKRYIRWFCLNSEVLNKNPYIEIKPKKLMYEKSIK